MESMMTIEQRERAALEALNILLEARAAEAEAKARIQANVRAPDGAITLQQWAELAEAQEAINANNQARRAEMDSASRLIQLASEELAEMLPRNVEIRLGAYSVWWARDRWDGQKESLRIDIKAIKGE